jgi:PAS domain S-box-containing protein
MSYPERISSGDVKTAGRRPGPRKNAGKTGETKHNGTGFRLELLDLLDALPFYVMLVDDQHHILHANRAVQAELGVDPVDILGKYCPNVIHGLDSPIEGCPLEEAAEKNRSIEREIQDPNTGRWIVSGVYPTKGSTADGRRVFFHMVTDINKRKQAEEQLMTSREQLRQLSRHCESVREEERTNLAREIHDELGQLLTGLKIDMSWVAKRIPEGEGPLIEKITSMDGLIDKAIETIKRISTELRPGVLDYLGLAAAIEWLAQELEKHTEIKFDFRSSPKEITMDRDCATALFRICQEALTNVIRHANATRVKITLRKQANRMVLVVRDNGKGIDKEQISDPKAFGLIGMRERARFFGGEVKINGAPGQGTTVAVSIPCPGART